MIERVTHFEGDESPSDAAVRWMARKMSGAMRADERAAFEVWLAQSPENRRAFAEIEGLLDRADGHGETLLTEEFERQLADEAGRENSAKRVRVVSIAATIAVAAVAVVIALFLQGPAAPMRYATDIGEFERVALADGSEIELNTATRLAVDFDQDARSVALLSGEAFFSVEKDRARPFTVKTGVAEIGVVGTAFSVTAGETTIVNVLAGVVDVTPREGPGATLLAGDAIEIGADGAAGEVFRFDASVAFAWRNGKARFDSAPLGRVVASLNRYFVEPIVLADASLADLPVTGEFDIRNRDAAVKALALIFDLESREEPARVILSRPVEE